MFLKSSYLNGRNFGGLTGFESAVAKNHRKFFGLLKTGLNYAKHLS